MTQALVRPNQQTQSPVRSEMSQIESVLVGGDLSKFSPQQRETYYMRVCETLELNPLARPFDYITLNGKLTLYANKGCAEQLRSIRKISVAVTDRQIIHEVCVVTVTANGPDGRGDSAIGAVNIANLTGEALANAMMKAETKAKRRVTLSICGLNMLDEDEVDDLSAQTKNPIVAEQPGAEDGVEMQDYRVTFGQWKRKSIGELLADSKIGPEGVAKYITYLEDPTQVAKRKPEQVPLVADFIERASDAIAMIEQQWAKDAGSRV